MVNNIADKIIDFFVAIDRIFAKIVTAILIVSLFTMVGLVFYQVLLRNIWNSGLAWGEIAARNLVIWIAFLGASLATRSRQHISVDFLTKILPKGPREALHFIFDGLACGISFLLAIAAFKFVLDERIMGTESFLNIPNWYIQIIIPFGFALISFQYAIGMVLDIRRFVMNRGLK